MYLIVGLGNPGVKYEKTRHNVGFMTVDQLNDRMGGKFVKGKGAYYISKVSHSSLITPVLLVKPITYMNKSGPAVRHVLDYYKISAWERLLIVLDDFNLPFGVLRLKPQGNAGGQNGLKSVIKSLDTNVITRLRFGIGNAHLQSGNDDRNFVLSGFNNQERKELPAMVEHAADAVECFLNDGVDTAMNRFNRNFLEEIN